MEDYFCIDDILAGQHGIYATFTTPGFLLGQLDPIGVADYNYAHASAERFDEDPNMDNHMPEGMRVSLPYWLVESLVTRDLVTVNLPTCYTKPVRQALRADARTVDLYSLCSAYYVLGVRLATLITDVTLPAVLVRAFAERCWAIADSAAFSGHKGVQAMRGLDWLERELFCDAHGVAVATRRWKERRCDRIFAIQSVLGKRRREQLGSPVSPPTRSRTA